MNNLKYTTNAAFAFPSLGPAVLGQRFTLLYPSLAFYKSRAKVTRVNPGQKEKVQAKGGDADIFNPNFVTGFCDAESCFSINILKNPFYGQNLG